MTYPTVDSRLHCNANLSGKAQLPWGALCMCFSEAFESVLEDQQEKLGTSRFNSEVLTNQEGFYSKNQ